MYCKFAASSSRLGLCTCGTILLCLLPNEYQWLPPSSISASLVVKDVLCNMTLQKCHNATSQSYCFDHICYDFADGYPKRTLHLGHCLHGWFMTRSQAAICDSHTAVVAAVAQNVCRLCFVMHDWIKFCFDSACLNLANQLSEHALLREMFGAYVHVEGFEGLKGRLSFPCTKRYVGCASAMVGMLSHLADSL